MDHLDELLLDLCIHGVFPDTQKFSKESGYRQTWQGFVSCYVLVLFHLTVESDIRHTEKTGRTGK